MKQSKQKQSTLFVIWLIAGLLTVATVGTHANTTESAEGHKLTWYPTFGLGNLLNQELPSNTRVNIAQLLKAKWYGTFDVSAFKKSGSERQVKNCEEFFIALDKDMKTVKGYELYYYTYLGLQCHTARAILEGKDAKRSYLTDFKFDESVIDVFPPDLADLVSEEMIKKVRNNKDINTLSKALRQISQLASIQVENEHEVVVRAIGGQKIIKLLAKGDFNNDGFEDIIVQTKNSIVQGTYKSTSLFLLTRKNTNPMFELVKEYETH